MRAVGQLLVTRLATTQSSSSSSGRGAAAVDRRAAAAATATVCCRLLLQLLQLCTDKVQRCLAAVAGDADWDSARLTWWGVAAAERTAHMPTAWLHDATRALAHLTLPAAFTWWLSAAGC